MRRKLLWGLLAALGFWIGVSLPVVVWAQQGGGSGTGKAIICPASAGNASIEVLAANGARLSATLSNDTATNIAVRFGFINGTTTPALDDTNSVFLLPGASYSLGTPSIYYGRIVCMSTGAAMTIHRTEITFP